jgi:hypothetical protein
MNRLFVIAFFVLLSGALQAQKLSVVASKDSILIGEELIIEYVIKTAIKDSISVPDTDDLLVLLYPFGSKTNGKEIELEFLESTYDTSYVAKNHKYWKRILTVTLYDSGLVLLKNHSVQINDSTFTFPEKEFSVFLVAPNDSIDMYDINEQFADVPNEPFTLKRFLKQWWWLVLGLAVIASFVVFRKRKKVYTAPEKRTSLKERTLKAIDALEESRLWEKDRLKEHFVELSFILRSYLAARYSINLLERTTTETRLLLREKGLNEETISIIIRILSQSDLVKFARSTPNTIDILKTATLARQIVAETSPLEIEGQDD